MRITASGLKPLFDLCTAMGFAVVDVQCVDHKPPTGTMSGGENLLGKSTGAFALAVNQSSNSDSTPPFSGLVQIKGFPLYGPHRGTESPFLNPEDVPAWLEKV